MHFDAVTISEELRLPRVSGISRERISLPSPDFHGDSSCDPPELPVFLFFFRCGCLKNLEPEPRMQRRSQR